MGAAVDVQILAGDVARAARRESLPRKKSVPALTAILATLERSLTG